MATETNTGTTTTADPAAAVEPGVAPTTAEAAGDAVTVRSEDTAKRTPARKRPAAKKSAAAKAAPTKNRPATKQSTVSAVTPEATDAPEAAAEVVSAEPATVEPPAELPTAEQTMIEMPLEGAEAATGSSVKVEAADTTARAQHEPPAAPQAAADAASAAPVEQPAAKKATATKSSAKDATGTTAAARKPAARKAAPKASTQEASTKEAASARATAAAVAAKPTTKKSTAKKKSTARKPAGSQASATGGNPLSGLSPKPRVVAPAPRLPRSGKTVVDGRGEPIVGARHGSPDIIDWSKLAEHHRPNRLTRIRKHRRWVYATASTDQYLVALAVADVGPMGTAFVMVTDLTTGEVLADSSRPGAIKPLVHVSYEPREGLTARYRLPGTEYDIHRERGSKETRVRVSLRRTNDSLPGLRSLPGISRVPLVRDLPTASHRPWLDIDLTLEEGAAPHLTAVSPVAADGGLVTSTVKTAAMPAWGTVTVHDGEATRVITMDGGTGGIDYTNGFLPRHTSWRWAYSTGRLGDGRLFGINLVSGFSGIGDDANENALWLDGALIPLPSEARIMCDENDLMAPWTIRTVDGSVHLRFQPRSIHAENVNIGVFRGSLKQPTGLISGHVMVDGERVVVSNLAAVVEDQDYLW